MRYVLLGEPAITQYFMIDTESGEVSLRKSLMDDPNNRESYGVCVVSDDRNELNLILQTLV